MADVHDGDRVGGVVDQVADAVFAAARSPIALDGLAQRCSDSMWVCGEGSVEKFDAGAGGRIASMRRTSRSPAGGGACTEPSTTPARSTQQTPLGHTSPGIS
jgi:hypothetical protein